jgi:AbrB family looped-hinge helix DNA binding protein
MAKISSKGQVTIPSEIRKLLGIRGGQEVVFTPVGDSGKIILRVKCKSISDVRGALKTARHVSIAEMRVGGASHSSKQAAKRSAVAAK